jgi:hypothetical protein
MFGRSENGIQHFNDCRTIWKCLKGDSGGGGGSFGGVPKKMFSKFDIAANRDLARCRGVETVTFGFIAIADEDTLDAVSVELNMLLLGHVDKGNAAKNAKMDQIGGLAMKALIGADAEVSTSR